MKILVATKETQGDRANDFNSCDEGVIVRFAFECDGESVDGKCGCRRALAGIAGGATTTFVVRDVGEIDEAKYREIVLDGLRTDGWLTRYDGGEGDDPESVAAHSEDIKELLRLAQAFPVGMVLEKRGDSIKERRRKVVTAR